ncbi:MAG: hypothetical protein EAZ42_07190 [Verrucomicrobia bacterium]|nr:MAG: hypothetical protein EAZ42_07190 [Verrucomicrobiota bacterium]
MKIDENTLALWLDDELTGELKSQVDAWAESEPEQLAARESAREWRRWIAAQTPSSAEPPYPDFFNSRILRAIESPALSTVPPARPRSAWWQRAGLPIAACFCMFAAYWVGTKTPRPYDIDVTGAPRAIPVESLIYTPESGVYAAYFDQDPAAMVIVLDGLKAIPDVMDFSEASYIPNGREIDSTAQQAPFAEPHSQP